MQASWTRAEEVRDVDLAFAVDRAEEDRVVDRVVDRVGNLVADLEMAVDLEFAPPVEVTEIAAADMPVVVQ